MLLLDTNTGYRSCRDSHMKLRSSVGRRDPWRLFAQTFCWKQDPGLSSQSPYQDKTWTLPVRESQPLLWAAWSTVELFSWQIIGVFSYGKKTNSLVQLGGSWPLVLSLCNFVKRVPLSSWKLPVRHWKNVIKS